MSTAPGIIEQRIIAGNQFTGVAGVGTPTDAYGIRKFSPAVAGGLFEFDFATQDGSFESYVIEQILADFTSSVTAVVNIVTDGVTTAQFAAPGGVVYFFRGPLELAWDQKIQLITTGATLDLVARVFAKPGRVRPA